MSDDNASKDLEQTMRAKLAVLLAARRRGVTIMSLTPVERPRDINQLIKEVRAAIAALCVQR